MFGRRAKSPSLTPAAIAAQGAAYDSLAEPLRQDVGKHIDASWNVEFHHSEGWWWFDIPGVMDGSFNGSLIEVAVYVEEYLRESGRWPTCARHGEPLRIGAAGPTAVVWACPGPPRHDAAVGHLDNLVG